MIYLLTISCFLTMEFDKSRTGGWEGWRGKRKRHRPAMWESGEKCNAWARYSRCFALLRAWDCVNAYITTYHLHYYWASSTAVWLVRWTWEPPWFQCGPCVRRSSRTVGRHPDRGDTLLSGKQRTAQTSPPDHAPRPQNNWFQIDMTWFHNTKKGNKLPLGNSNFANFKLFWEDAKMLLVSRYLVCRSWWSDGGRIFYHKASQTKL